MTRRRPQDPQGAKARTFQRHLQNHPEHRRGALEGRRHSPYEDTDLVGLTAVFLLVSSILGMAVWRLLTGTMWP